MSHKLNLSIVGTIALLTSLVGQLDAGIPTVSAIKVRGSTWVPTGDYEIPTGGPSQLDTLSWPQIDEIKIHFSENVSVSQSDFGLFGVNTPVYSPSSFSYDAGTFVATYMLGTPLTADKLLLQVKESITSVATGDNLDGDWTNTSSTYNSGNGSAGGEMLFRFNVLPGDLDNDGTVSGTLSSPPLSGTGDYAPFVAAFNDVGDGVNIQFEDLNGDGAVSIFDVSPISGNIGTSLPSGEPVVVPEAGTYAILGSFLAIAAPAIRGRRL